MVDLLLSLVFGFGFVHPDTANNTSPLVENHRGEDDVQQASLASLEKRLFDVTEQRFQIMEKSITTTVRQLLQESRLVNDAAIDNGYRGDRILRENPLPESNRNGSDGTGSRKCINVSSTEKFEEAVSLQGF